MYLNRIQNKIEEEYKKNNISKRIGWIEIQQSVFILSSIPFGMLEQYGGNVEQVPERVSKNRDKTLLNLCGISLDEGERWCGVAAEALSE